MEQIVGALAGIGLSRDIAVNLATDFLFTVALGVIVALVTNWARDQSEARNAKRLLEGAYRAADQCIVDFLCAGHTIARLLQADGSTRMQLEIDRLGRRFRGVVAEGQRFEQRLGLTGSGLSKRALGEAITISRGLAPLMQYSGQMEGRLAGLSGDAAKGQPSTTGKADRLDHWLNALELSAEDLDSRKRPLSAERVPIKRKRSINLRDWDPPTGRLDFKSLNEDAVANLAKAIWRSKGVDRAAVRNILLQADR